MRVLGVGGVQDVLPRADAEDELQEMQRDREDERRPRHGRQMAEEGLARIDERPDIVHAPDDSGAARMATGGESGWLIPPTGFEPVSPP